MSVKRWERAGLALFVVLLTQALLEDPRWREVVLPRIRARLEARTARLVPVLLAPCDWKSEPLLGERHPAPSDGREDWDADPAAESAAAYPGRLIDYVDQVPGGGGRQYRASTPAAPVDRHRRIE